MPEHSENAAAAASTKRAIEKAFLAAADGKKNEVVQDDLLRAYQQLEIDYQR